MTRKRWYFYSLFLPLILPGLIMLGAKLSHTFLDGHSPMGWLSLFAVIELTSGGFQYSLFIFFVYGWAKNKSIIQIMRASWAVPLWFWPWYTVWLLMVTALIGKAKFFLLFGLFVIPYGYFYILLAHLLAWVFKKAGLIVD